MAEQGAGSAPIAESIGLLFGGLWSYLGATSLPERFRTPAEAAGAVFTLALVVALWIRREPAGGRSGLFRRRGYLIALALEIAAICAVSVLLPSHGLKEYLIPAVGVIVGLHFIGLWRATRSAVFLWIAGAMCAVSAVAALLPEASDGVHLRNAVIGFGNAVVLWIAASWTAKASAPI